MSAFNFNSPHSKQQFLKLVYMRTVYFDLVVAFNYLDMTEK